VTISTARCDRCGSRLSGLVDPESLPAQGESPDRPGVRFSYHPGEVSLVDDSGVLCLPCWKAWTEPLGPPTSRVCAICSTALSRKESLFLRPVGAQVAWQLCARHAADQLNELLTVEPKLDRETFRLPFSEPRA
jgi:hypothetical protein